ncbi:DUF5057 domain-containing protein [Paenibacillus silvisoli]|uniref:DUF5057 domain-containing protein n=1 Tax=Paenibacillus silvisoli TaxID=3110539 RepID=UPI0028047F74|nr:DUF5057 domain-containing protein [Paenibacillus silvisoli]
MNARMQARIKARTIVIRLLFLSMIAALIAVPGLVMKDAYADGTVYYAIKAGDKFVTVGASDVLYATTTSIGTSAEQFERILISGNTYAFKSKLTGKYVKTSTLAATSGTIDTTEKFTLDSDGYLSVSGSANYVGVDSNGKLVWKSKKSSSMKFSFAEKVTKLLEITESGSSDLQSVIGTKPNVSIDTISMKRFVALRGELDGKYDAIYIGKGNYNPSKVALTTSSNREASHDTKDLENDITMLKANEIVNNFITKGQLVFIYSDSNSKSGLLYQGYFNSSDKFVSVKGNLYNTFAPYSTAGRDNVEFLNASGLSNLDDRFTNYSDLLTQRPGLVISGYPTSYLRDASALYRAGDKLTYKFNVPNYSDFGAGRITANLYIGQDQAVRFGNDQIVASTVVTAGTTDSELSYVLPKGYSGLYYWKLEIVDQATKMKSYETGVFRYRDQLTKVRVLQVMHNSSDASSLLKSGNMNQSYLKSTDEYDISITTMKFDAFNGLSAQEKAGLNGSYDMLIFGFADSYNANASITQATADAVNNFIRTGQSVMFTHDTVFSSSGTDKNMWIKEFQKTTGQIDPWTNLGFGAPYTSKSVKKVNDGLLNQFPFNLNNATPEVATTHNQYFTLDLEDESVVPWYNITGSVRDGDDSWNHYYTYSKGNVTYSGTGHTSTGFPDWEQKLFVNTMYRAYMGSNHAPLLTVYNPLDYTAAKDNFIPSYQNINLSFMPEDYDFADRNLTVSIKYTYKEDSVPKTVTIPDSTAVSGSTVNKVIPNPYTEDGDLTIDITVTDKTGAKVSKSIPVKVKKISSYLTVKRTISGLTSGSELVMDKGATATMTYTATPKPIAKSGSVDQSNLKIQSISFAETLPAGLEIAGTLPSGFTKSGDVNSGYKISGTLSNIEYRLSGTQYIADPVTFNIEVKPVVTGTLPLNDSSLTFKDVGQSTSMALPFDAYSINSIVRISDLSIAIRDLTLVNKKDSSGAMVYDTATIIPTFTPVEATPKFSWTSSNPGVATIITTQAGNGYVTGVARGTTTITVTDAVTGKTATAQVTVLESGLNIIGNDTVVAGTSIDLSGGLVKPSRETVSSIEWSVFNTSDGALSSNGGWQTSFTGLKAGKVTVTLHVTTTYNSTIDGSQVTNSYEVTKDITITNPVMKLSGSGALTIGDTTPLTAVLQKSLTDETEIKDTRVIQSVTWSVKEAGKQNLISLPASTGKVLTNEVKALAPGSLTIVASVKLLDNTVLTKELPVTIDYPVLSLEGASSLAIGDSSQLTAKLQKSQTNTTVVSDDESIIKSVTWSLKESDASSLASLAAAGAKQSTNTLQALAPGRVTVQVAVKLMDDTVLTKELPITIEPPVLALSGASTARIGDQLSLTASLQKSQTNTAPLADMSMIKSVAWSLQKSDGAMADLAGVGAKQTTNTLKALAPGSVIVRVTVTLMDNSVLTKDLSITIESPVLSLIGSSTVSIGDQLSLTTDLNRSQSDSSPLTDMSLIKSITWSKSETGGAMASLSTTGTKQASNTLSALAPGHVTVQVSVTLLNDTKITDSRYITIEHPVLTLTGDQTIGIGDTSTLTAVLHKSASNSAAVADDSVVQKVVWSLGGSEDADLTTTTVGKTFTNGVKAVSPGEVTVTATVTLLDGSVITKDLAISIEKPVITLTAASKVGVGDLVEIDGTMRQSQTDSSVITDSSLIKSVTWSLAGSGVDDIASLPASTGKSYDNTLKAIGGGDVTVVVTVKLLDDTVVKDELALTVQNRKPELGGSVIVNAGTSINDLEVSWIGAAGKPGFTYTPEWILNDNSDSTKLTGAGDSAKLSTGWNDGGTVTVIVKVLTPAGVVLKDEKQVNIINISLPDQVKRKIGQTFNLMDAKSLKIWPAELRSSIAAGLSWSSANSSIASVSANGVITANARGTTYITMHSERGITRTVKVTVENSDKY